MTLDSLAEPLGPQPQSPECTGPSPLAGPKSPPGRTADRGFLHLRNELKGFLFLSPRAGAWLKVYSSETLSGLSQMGRGLRPKSGRSRCGPDGTWPEMRPPRARLWLHPGNTEACRTQVIESTTRPVSSRGSSSEPAPGGRYPF